MRRKVHIAGKKTNRKKGSAAWRQQLCFLYREGGIVAGTILVESSKINILREENRQELQRNNEPVSKFTGAVKEQCEARKEFRSRLARGACTSVPGSRKITTHLAGILRPRGGESFYGKVSFISGGKGFTSVTGPIVVGNRARGFTQTSPIGVQCGARFHSAALQSPAAAARDRVGQRVFGTSSLPSSDRRRRVCRFVKGSLRVARNA